MLQSEYFPQYFKCWTDSGSRKINQSNFIILVNYFSWFFFLISVLAHAELVNMDRTENCLRVAKQICVMCCLKQEKANFGVVLCGMFLNLFTNVCVCVWFFVFFFVKDSNGTWLGKTGCHFNIKRFEVVWSGLKWFEAVWSSLERNPNFMSDDGKKNTLLIKTHFCGENGFPRV